MQIRTDVWTVSGILVNQNAARSAAQPNAVYRSAPDSDDQRARLYSDLFERAVVYSDGRVILRRLIANTIRSLGKRATTVDSGYLRRTKYRDRTEEGNQE